METYIKTNELLKQTTLPGLFHQGELQKKADEFLEAMQELYGDDEQYKYLLEEVRKDKIEPLSAPLKGGKWAGFLAKMFNRLRDHELEQLRIDYEKAIGIVWSSDPRQS